MHGAGFYIDTQGRKWDG